MTVAADLVAWATERAENDESDAVDDAALLHLRDTVAVAVAGAGEPPVRSMRGGCRAFAEEWPAKALVLGTACHALDYDNAQTPSLVHPSCVVVPTALLALAMWGPGECGLLRAIAIGEEISVWLGESAVRGQSSLMFDRGLHPTGVCTPIGAAVTAGLLAGLDGRALAHAVGAAASLSGGILEGNRTGGQVKPMHAGFATHAGLLAVELARAGMTAPAASIEGRFGFARALIGDHATPDPALLPAEGSRWRMQDVITKPYPVNGFAHSTIDAAMSLREQGFGLEPGARLTVGVAGPTLRTIAEPRDEKLRPATSYAARFSGPILAALALRGGSGLGVGLRDFPPDLVADEELLAQAGRVEIVADEERTNAFPQQVGATAHAVTADGRTFEAAVTSSLGSPGRPLSPEQHRVKFDDCVHHAANGHAAELWRLVNTAAEGSRDAAADIVTRILDPR